MHILDLVLSDRLIPKRTYCDVDECYLSACPGCGGADAFIIWKNCNRYYCRGCLRRGDPVQYLRDFHGMSYREACLEIGRECGEPCTQLWVPFPSFVDRKQWEESTLEFVTKAHWRLLGSSRLGELFEKGFTLGTIETYCLGLDECGGVVVPTFNGDILTRVRVLVDGVYSTLAGSREVVGVYGAGVNRPVVVVEEELDGMLIEQFAGDVCAVVALGGVRRVEAVEGLMEGFVLFAVDDAGLFYEWGKRYPHMLFLPKIVQTGVDLRKWVLEGVRSRR